MGKGRVERICGCERANRRRFVVFEGRGVCTFLSSRRLLFYHEDGSLLFYRNHSNYKQNFTALYAKWPKTSYLLPWQIQISLVILPVVCMERKFNISIYIVKGKGKAVPLQAWSGPEGSSKLRFPDFMTTQNVSLTHRPPLPPGNTPGTHFC